MPVNRKSPSHTTTYLGRHWEFIEAQMDETGQGPSLVVREAIQFYIDNKVKPEVMLKVIEEQKAARKAARKAERAARLVEVEMPERAKKLRKVA